MNFWQHLKKLFAAQPAQPQESQAEDMEEEVLHHGVIERTERENAHFQAWLESPRRREMLNWIWAQYQYFQRTGYSNDTHLDFLVIPSVQGLVIHYDPERWDCDDFVALFDYFKLKTKTFGYWSHVSDVRSLRIKDCIETTQRHYLKPPRQFGLAHGQAADQVFGNVMTSLQLCNERLVNLKFSATHYSDRNFQQPRPFAELLEFMCKS